MSEQVGNKQIIQGEDIVVTVDSKPTLHATNHSLKVDLEVKDIRTKDTNGKEKYPGDISWSVDVEGLVVIDPDLAATRDNAEDILQSILSKSSVGVVLKAALNGALTKNYSGWRQRHLQLHHHRKRQPHPG